jgi:hypothetical protein
MGVAIVTHREWGTVTTATVSTAPAPRSTEMTSPAAMEPKLGGLGAALLNGVAVVPVARQTVVELAEGVQVPVADVTTVDVGVQVRIRSVFSATAIGDWNGLSTLSPSGSQ